MDGPHRFWLVLLFTALLCAHPRPAAAEPPVAEVRQRALEYADLDRSLDRWSARARWRHLLPRVTAKVGGLDQLDESTDFDEYLSRDSSGDLLFDAARTANDRKERGRLDWEVRAVIDFRGLIFDRAELQAARETRIRAGERRELVERVHHTYFERRELLRRLRDAEPDDRREIAARIVLLEARLDGLTGGWFSASLRGGSQ